MHVKHLDLLVWFIMGMCVKYLLPFPFLCLTIFCGLYPETFWLDILISKLDILNNFIESLILLRSVAQS